jgi:riboflavin-specific deaminase-like protein
LPSSGLTPEALRETIREEQEWELLRVLCRSGALAGDVAPAVQLDKAQPRGWSAAGTLSKTLSEMLDLYAPLCSRVGERYALAHVGQSIDGFIAGADETSATLNHRANIVHLHRLRALFDAVLIGGNTARCDNPRLTTRLVAGDNPVRVIVDLRLRCDPELRVFQDGLAPTLLVAASDAPNRSYPAHVQRVSLHNECARATLREVLDSLAAQGLPRVFIEGGGRTVSKALDERVIQRLHVAIAPLIIGDGVPGIRLPELRRFSDALRPSCRTFEMGTDVLFDFDLSSIA